MVVGSRDGQAGQALCASVYFYATGAGGEKVTQNLVSYHLSTVILRTDSGVKVPFLVVWHSLASSSRPCKTPGDCSTRSSLDKGFQRREEELGRRVSTHPQLPLATCRKYSSSKGEWRKNARSWLQVLSP